jgi:CelD/BcsL family acetyltransferase involved in cellulose biosynthesis
MQRIDINRVPWDELDRFADRTIYQTLPWINFVAQTQAAEPVVAVVKENGETIGYFTGLIVKKFGFKILGSPFKGWTTSYQGFNLLPGSSRRQALAVLPSFAFSELKCHFLEMIDRYVSEADYKDLSFSVTFQPGFEIDLTLPEDKLFANMRRSCRQDIRKAAKFGIVIEEASDPGFVEDYFAHVRDVFARKSLVPTYGIERVRAMISNLYPTGNLLLLRARNPEGICIAALIFLSFNDTAYIWGGGTTAQYLKLCPYEAAIWYAIQRLKGRGIKKLDMGGGGVYKKKYGGSEIAIPRLMKAKYHSLILLREAAYSAWRTLWKWRAKF